MLQNVLGAFGSALNGISTIILATTFGFGAFPSSLLFIVGAIGLLFTGQVSPVMLQSELIVLAGSLGRNRNERLCICVYAGILTTLCGVTGIIGSVVDFVGDDILFGVMAGVGIMLTGVSINMIKEDLKLGLISLVCGVSTYLATRSVIYTMMAAILIPGILWNIFWKKGEDVQEESSDAERFQMVRLSFNPVILRGVLAISTLLIGGIISGAAINASLAGSEVNFNSVTWYTGLGTTLSSLFGGAPGGIIVAGTASAPDPLLSGVLLMIFMTLLMLLKLIGPIKKVLPLNCVSGLLFVMGAMVIFPENALNALSGSPLVGGVTMLTAAMVDPFSGMCAGLLVRYILMLL